MIRFGWGFAGRLVDVDLLERRRVACVALVLVSAVIPWAVYTRYVLNSASSWPEPMAVLLTVGITFIGSANCLSPLNMSMTVGSICCRRCCAAPRCSLSVSC